MQTSRILISIFTCYLFFLEGRNSLRQKIVSDTLYLTKTFGRFVTSVFSECGVSLNSLHEKKQNGEGGPSVNFWIKKIFLSQLS